MTTETKPTGRPAELEADTQAVLELMMTGKSLDPEAAQRIRARGDRIREETFQKHGLLDSAVPAIREPRGELPSAW